MKYFKNQLKFKAMKHNQNQPHYFVSTFVDNSSVQWKKPGAWTIDKKIYSKKIFLNLSIVYEYFFLYSQHFFLYYSVCNVAGPYFFFPVVW